MSVQSPRVSVFIASYNGVPFVREAVGSLLRQTYEDLEVVIADDGSQAATLDALRELVRHDPRVVLVECEHRGQIATLNTAVAHCRGELIARLDHDDVASPQRICRQVDYLDAHPDCAAVGTGVRQIDAAGVVVDDGRRTEFLRAGGTDVTKFPPRLQLIGGSTLMARRSALEAVGTYRAAMMAAEDRDLCWRLATIGDIHVIEEPLVDHRVHGANLSTRGARIQLFSSILADLSAIARSHGVDDNDIVEGIVPGEAIDAVVAAYATRIGARYPVRALATYLMSSGRARRIEGSLPRSELFARAVREIYENPRSIPAAKTVFRAARAGLRP